MDKENSSCIETTDVSPKKRKKQTMSASSVSKLENSFPVNSGNADFYKQVVLKEEEEALARDPDKDLELYLKTCENFRTLAKEINDLKNSNPSQTSDKIINEKRIQASLLFVVLKKLNRLEKVRLHQNREKLHKAKQQADSCHLQLQNLLYEILHLEKEITKCLQFKSKDEKIDLVAVDKFYEEAPNFVSRPEVTKADSHQLKLARLEWELKQRKELAAMCNDLQTEKEKKAAEIKKKQAQLDNLVPMLKNLFNASKPVQEALGLPSGPSPFEQRVAEQLLPPPLYFLFVQANALIEAGGKDIAVKIEGDEEEVQRMKQTLSEAVVLDDSDSDGQEDNVGEISKRHHGHRKKSRQDKLQERRRQILMKHPLTIILNVALKDGQGSISLEFFYMVNLHIVTVKPKVKLPPQDNISSASSLSKLIDSEHILTELFAEDFGEGSPNTANYYQLKQVNIDNFDSSQLGLAYVWAQRVCGLNFISSQGGDAVNVQANKPVPSRQVSQLSLPTTIKAIKQRLKARIELCAQIKALENGKIDDTEVRQFFPSRLVAELTQWTPLSWPQYQALGFTKPMVDHQYINERDILYKGTLVHGNARMTFAVAIKNCYPLLPPVFALQATCETKTIQASNNDSIRDMEREVNVYFMELIRNTKSVQNLLTAQVLRLITNFDILLETSTNQDFARDKIFIKANRGRNRALPLKQMELRDGVFHFTQR